MVAAIHAPRLTRKEDRRRPLTFSSQARAASSLTLPRQLFDSVRETNHSLVVAVDDTAYDSITIPLMGFASKGSLLFCLHGNVSWTGNRVIAVIASRGTYVIALLQRSVDGSTHPYLIPGLNDFSVTRFMMDNISFHTPSVEWNSMCLRMQRAAYLPTGSLRKSSP